MSWKIFYYNEQVKESIALLPKGLKARYFYLTDAMKISGANLGEPHTLSVGNGLFELRVKAQEGIARGFFCTLVGQRIMMLHTFIKKTQKTPKKELEIARKRLKEVKQNENR